MTYVARFATTAAKLEAYLARKLRERGFEGEEEDGGEPPRIGPIVARFVELGYIDDAGYARSRAAGLTRRGYGARRVAQALVAAGIDEDLRTDVAPGEADGREAIVSFARRRRMGPFDPDRPDTSAEGRKRLEKQLAAMARAGHDFTMARKVLDAGTTAELEQWVAEAREEENE